MKYFVSVGMLLFVFTGILSAQTPPKPVVIKTGNMSVADAETERIKKLEEQNAELKKQLEELKSTVTILSGKFTEVQKDNAALKLTVVGLNNNMGTLKNSISAAETNFASFKNGEYATHTHKLHGMVGNEMTTDRHLLLNSSGGKTGLALSAWASTTTAPEPKQ
ncbi:hypothetical protein [Ferruginibacter profundus]